MFYNYLIDFVPMENKFCESETRSNWTDISDAKQKCFDNENCNIIEAMCGNENDVWDCPDGDTIFSSGCGTVLYKPGKIVFYSLV